MQLTPPPPPALGAVPAWARGTFIWRLMLADRPDALVEARAAIAAVANRLDHAVEHVVILTNAIGADEGRLPWDGIWPYWQRLTYRIGGGWDELARFMLDMRCQHRAHVSFHVNLTDANSGLRLYPETRAFFARLCEAQALYARPQGRDDQPWFGLPYVPQTIPAGDASDIFALVNYQRFWDSGLAREQIDGLFGRLPYLPPLLYVDVLGPKGWCIHPGYPDGGLGGSRATQLAGIQAIVKYIRDCGSEVAGESPDRLTEHADPPIRYSWSHGGLASNDYSLIGSGYGTGAMAGRRGGKAMQVYGNQGGYHLQCGDQAPELIRNQSWTDALHSPLYDGLREMGDATDLARQFFLTVAPELYHLGCGAARLPGGPGWELLDAAEGRVRLDALTLRGPDGTITVLEAEAATLLGSARVLPDPWASGGHTVGDLGEALGNGVAFRFDLPAAGTWELFVRYAAPGGGVLGWQLDGEPCQRLELPDTGAWHFYGDYRLELPLAAGPHELRLVRERLFAAWSDGARAEWTLAGGFRAWHGAVVLGQGGDRFWPDTWSGQRRILLYSEAGGERDWTLPEGWAGLPAVQLLPLTAAGRAHDRAQTLAVSAGGCRILLAANEFAVLFPLPGGSC